MIQVDVIIEVILSLPKRIVAITASDVRILPLKARQLKRNKIHVGFISIQSWATDLNCG